jgi:hypothetical protein
MANAITNTRDRARELLGNGIAPEQVASALGITSARISQLLSEPEFMAEVAELRFNNLQQHNQLDAKYLDIENTLVERLADCLPMMYKPQEILRAIQVINGAKRRGTSAPEHITMTQTVINLNLPNVAIEKFRANGQNQIMSVGNQDLVTIQSSTLLDRVKQKASKQISTDSI